MKIHKITYKFPELNNVLLIEWTLGNTCNYNCSYCLPVLHNNSFPWINLEASKKFIDKLHEHYTKLGITHFIWKFGGGEPTLYKDFSQLCEYINKNDNNLIIPITNGSRKMDWWQDNYKNFFAVHFSIHPEFCKAEHIRDVCDFLIERKVDSICHVMMKPDDWSKCMEMIDTLKNSKRTEWGIQAKPLHHAWKTDNATERDLYPYTDDQKQIFKHTIRSQHRVNEKVDTKLDRSMVMIKSDGIIGCDPLTLLEEFDAYWAVANDIVDWRGYKCKAGINRIYINFDKRMYLGAGCRVLSEGFSGKKYDEEFKFPTNEVICNQERWVCIAAVQVPKTR